MHVHEMDEVANETNKTLLRWIFLALMLLVALLRSDKISLKLKSLHGFFFCFFAQKGTTQLHELFIYSFERLLKCSLILNVGYKYWLMATVSTLFSNIGTSSGAATNFSD